MRLEPLRPEHEEALWLASRDPRTWRWLPIVQPQTRDEWSAFFESALAAAGNGTEMPFVTLRSEKVVGSTRFLALRPEHGSVEIGWTWLQPGLHGAPVRMSKRSSCRCGTRSRRGGVGVSSSKTDALNERARGALEALGATFEGIHRNHMLVRDGENRDSAWYSVIDEEWPTVREHLEARLAEK